MKYTLWRGDQLIGHVHVVFPSTDPDLISGMLHPTPAYADIAPVMQARLLIVPTEPIVQHAIERISSAGEVQRPPNRAPLHPLTADEA